MHYVRIIKGKIAEFDTGSEHYNILIDDSILGTHFDSWIYKDGKFEPDPDWVQRENQGQFISALEDGVFLPEGDRN